MKRLAVLVAVVALLAAPLISGLSDITALVANTSIPDNEITSSQSEANNSSASATITITMYAVAE